MTEEAPTRANSELTRRETEVAELVADGLSNREVAVSLHVSVRTVESHVGTILRKLGLRSRSGLARRLDSVVDGG
ncbi:response regulator transcription factor [Microbacterium luteolum]|uniref:response regulator transcription factor n=1 Tax=Microbacterium luteolum TaxID=69367 RepID=UPI00249ABD63|nr:helix-turn-helix transcriptional regulator [Microbacterium luteolum]